MPYLDRPIRRSSLMGPWGVGAIVPFPNDESLMIAGLDAWNYPNPEAFAIKDDRLIKRLGVNELRWPPDFRKRNEDPENCNVTIPAIRFPTWYYCPFCGQMKKATYYEAQPMCDAIQWETGRKCSQKYRRKMVPERFIVVCPEGHIDDFPVAEWVHYGSGHTYNPDKCKIRRSTGGASANLTGVFYECVTCGVKRSMAGATSRGALTKIQYKCKATKPWLGTSGDEVCTANPEDLKVVLRGATNVWFADTISSISIPTDDENNRRKIMGIVNNYFDAVNAQRVNGEFDRGIISVLAAPEHLDPDELYQAFVDRGNNIQRSDDTDGDISEDEYRMQEYKILCKTSGSDAIDFHSICLPISEYDKILKDVFDSISLVPKLRETRAFIGFSRLEPSQKTISEKKKDLRLGTKENWLPAIEVYGEGIFFKFNRKNLEQWAQRQDVKDRISKLDRSFHKSKFGKDVKGNLRPEYVLVHTFAHLIINQLSYDCGYGSASIKERIYCERNNNELGMYGVLIYTASGDSEGSLGGLVRQGEHGKLEDTILNAIRNAAWCTSDPVCIQSSGQGLDSLNLAACHNCALLPETCCENGNRLLDRGIVVGTLENPEMGFFKGLKE